MGSRQTLWATLFVLAMTSNVLGQSNPKSGWVLKPARSVVVPITDSGKVDVAQGEVARRLILKVVGYSPPAEGAVEVVVTIKCRGTKHELGRVGIFPNRPFTALDSASAQRFGLPLPDDAQCADLRTADVRLEPTNGTGVAARVVIESISIEKSTPARPSAR